MPHRICSSFIPPCATLVIEVPHLVLFVGMNSLSTRVIVREESHDIFRDFLLYRVLSSAGGGGIWFGVSNNRWFSRARLSTKIFSFRQDARSSVVWYSLLYTSVRK